MISYGEYADWMPFAMFIISMFSSGIGAILAAANKLWGGATFFTIMFAASIAATLIYGM